jgi:hypothetical protein
MRVSTDERRTTRAMRTTHAHDDVVHDPDAQARAQRLARACASATQLASGR